MFSIYLLIFQNFKYQKNLCITKVEKKHGGTQFLFLFKGPRTVFYSIRPNFDSLWLE